MTPALTELEANEEKNRREVARILEAMSREKFQDPGHKEMKAFAYSSEQVNVVQISDIHGGGRTSVCPPGLIDCNGAEITLTRRQEHLWEFWCEFIKTRIDPLGDDFVLMLVGDLIEGIHHRTKQIISPDVRDHMNVALELLRPIAEKAQRVYICAGTESHVGNREESIGEILGAVRDPSTGMRVWDRIDRKIFGHQSRWVHHMPASTTLRLHGTQMSAQATEHQSVATRFGFEVPTNIVAGHRHVFNTWRDGFAQFPSMPSWQNATRFVGKVVPAAECQIGGVLSYHTPNRSLPFIDEWLRVLATNPNVGDIFDE